MAQSGYTPLSIYHSATANAVPTSANLTSGELAINYTDGKLYYKDNSGTVQVIANKSGASGSFVNISASGYIAAGANVSAGTSITAATTITAGTNFIGPGTGLTGNAVALSIGGNANTVTTNANLTGVITSVGNLTSIANQTGNGSVFVVSTNPVVVNPTITNYVETLYSATGNTTINLANGTVQKIATSGATTITLPSSVTGKSVTVIVSYTTTGDTIAFAGGSTIKWAGGTVPVGTGVTGKFDIFNFYQDGTNTYAAIYGQNF